MENQKSNERGITGVTYPVDDSPFTSSTNQHTHFGSKSTMNPVTFFKRLVSATVFNTEASKFLQGISGHKPDNDAVKLIKNLKHIQKEAQEGIDAIEAAIKAGQTELTQEQTQAVRDAYADVRVLLDGAAQMANFPWLRDYKAVLQSLITRFDSEGADAVKTQIKYEKIGVETRIHEDPETGMKVNIVVDGSKSADPSEYPEGKWLKSHQYEQPTFDDSQVIIIR